MNKAVYVCSPYRGNVERNVEYAKQLTKQAIMMKLSPITPHLYITQVLDDAIPTERELGLSIGSDLLRHCDCILIGAKYGISDGMKAEISIAERLGLDAISESGEIISRRAAAKVRFYTDCGICARAGTDECVPCYMGLYCLNYKSNNVEVEE